MTPDDPRHGSKAGAVAHFKAGQKACDSCLDARRRYDRRRKKDVELGRPRTVSTARVYRHIDALTGAGMLPEEIEVAAGISNSRLMGRQSRRVITATARRILAVVPEPGVNYFPAWAARRRIQALSVMGHSMYVMADELGCQQSWVSEAATGARGWKRMDSERWLAIDAMYERLWNVAGTEQPRRRALARGWVGPMAWDDIDDPAETPSTDNAPRRIEPEDVEFVLSHDPVATARQLADRFGCTPDGIQHACRRAGRDDLLAKLARNAGLASRERAEAS